MDDDWEDTADRRQAPPAQIAAAVVLLVLLGTVVALAGRSRTPDDQATGADDGLEIEQDLPAPPDQAEATPGQQQDPEPPGREAIGEWKALPDAPIDRRSDAVAVWTGHEVVVWGGRGGDWRSDGAAYDPARDRWRELPPAPRAAAASTSAAWTGREVIVAGAERGGALAYDPEGDVWRELPAPPLSFAGRTVAVWNGSEVVFAGRQAAEQPPTSHDQRHLEGAVIAYDPSRDRWRELPPSPLDDHGLLPSAVALGERVALLGTAENADGHPHLAVSLYDPQTDEWGDPELSPFSTTTDTWLLGTDTDGDRIGVAGSLLRGSNWRFQAAWWVPDEGWRRLPTPRPDGHAEPFAAMAPAGLVVWSGTVSEEGWVLTNDGWQPLPEAPVPPRNGAAAVWTGHELVVWGGRQGAQAHDDGMRWRARDRTLEYCCSP